MIPREAPDSRRRNLSPSFRKLNGGLGARAAMVQKFAFSPEAASRAMKSCVEAHTCGVTFHEESRPVSIVPSFTEYRFVSSIMEIPAVISSRVCVSSSSVNYNFFRLNRTNLVARRFCRSIVLDLDTRTWIVTSLRSIHTFIHITFK